MVTAMNGPILHRFVIIEYFSLSYLKTEPAGQVIKALLVCAKAILASWRKIIIDFF
jgi:hypothetical protein